MLSGALPCHFGLHRMKRRRHHPEWQGKRSIEFSFVQHSATAENRGARMRCAVQDGPWRDELAVTTPGDAHTHPEVHADLHFRLE